MRRGIRSRIAGTLAAVIMSSAMGPVFAQTAATKVDDTRKAGGTVTPSVSIGPVYDTNIFFTPVAEADVILRLTAGLAAERTTPRATFASQYRFDAEQFQDHPALDSALARQSGDARAQWRASSGVTVAVNGGYDRTPVPAELNLTTGLAEGRVQSWRAAAGSDVTAHPGKRTTIGTGYAFTRDVITGAGEVNAHRGRIEWTQQVGAHNDLHLKYLPEFVMFNSILQPDVLWHVVAVGWTHEVTRVTRLTIEGGPRVGDGEVRPYVLLSFARNGRTGNGAVTYTRNTTTALGVRQPIEAQSVLGTAGYRVPGTIELTVQGGVYRNVIDRQAIDVYRLGGGLIQHLGGKLAISATAAYDLQHGRFSGVPSLIVAPVTLITGPKVQRTVFAIALVVAPTVHPRSDRPPSTETRRQP